MTWKTHPLGELFKTAAGGTPSTLNRAFYDGGTVPWLLSGAVRVGVIREAKTFITELGLENCNAKMFPRETVLVALYGATAGQVGILDIEASTNQAVLGIYPNRSFLPKFVFYLLLSSYDALIAQAIGNAQPNISGQKVKNVPVPLLPLAEQQRIVGILDEAFAGIATAKAKAEKNLRNARALFESTVDTTVSDFITKVPGKPLGKMVDSISTGPFGSLLHKSDYEEGGIPLVNPINIDGDKIVPDARKAVGAETAKRLARYVLEEGDVVTARRGEIGRCASIGPEQAGWICGTGSFFIRPGAGIDSRFLTHLIRSQPYRSQLEGLSGRATMPSIGNDDLSNLVVHVPSLGEQQRAEARLTSLNHEIERLEALCRQKLAALDALKKSLLHQAFNGELTRVN